MAEPGGAVFSPPSSERAQNLVNWWRYVPGAHWRHPEGPDAPAAAPEEPAVQIAYEDAKAYAKWVGGRLPTEAEWEYAARGGLEQAVYAWGETFTPGGEQMANTWQGIFPVQNTSDDGYSARAPVACFPPNGFGLYDMIGNVWEWTSSEYGDPAIGVIKGGSYLCAENFCARFRPAARHPQEKDFSTNHIGFRIVWDIAEGDPSLSVE